jgi:hypothetical protein
LFTGVKTSDFGYEIAQTELHRLWSNRITQIMKYSLLLIQETWQQKMQITDWAQPAVRYTLRSNIARAIFRRKSAKLLQKQRYKRSNYQTSRHLSPKASSSGVIWFFVAQGG